MAGLLTGGVSVVITGSGFTGATYRLQSRSARRMPLAARSTRSPQITAVAPAEAAGVVDLTVTTPIGTSVTSSADQFVYEPAPTVTGVSPTVGYTTGATSVTITGTGFTATTSAGNVKQVYFGSSRRPPRHRLGHLDHRRLAARGSWPKSTSASSNASRHERHLGGRQVHVPSHARRLFR